MTVITRAPAVALGLLGLVGLVACPAPPTPRHAVTPPDTAALAGDAHSLAQAARQAGLPAPDTLVEAYLQHWRGSATEAQRVRCRWLTGASSPPRRPRPDSAG